MRLEPVEDWITAISILHQKPSPIIKPDVAKDTSRCFLIESVGPKAAEAGYKVGDIVVAKAVFDLKFYSGVYLRVTFVVGEVIQRVREAPLNEFVLLSDVRMTADSINLAGSKAAAE